MSRKKHAHETDGVVASAPAESFIGCTIKELPADAQVAAARMATEFNPANRPAVSAMLESMSGEPPTPQFLAVLTSKYWGTQGVDLSVSFMETTAPELRDKILAHANAWGEFSNVKFRWTQSAGKVRISRGPGGYWSYLGTDVLQIPINQPTMNLEAFTLNTPDTEYRRVVRHEFGHTLGWPHEHLRSQIIARLDPQKTIDYFKRYQGWDAKTTQQQVLTALEESQLIATPEADEVSIMTYQLPGGITRDGKPIPGGLDIDAVDRAFAAKMYPMAVTPTSPGASSAFAIKIDVANKTITIPAGWAGVTGV